MPLSANMALSKMQPCEILHSPVPHGTLLFPHRFENECQNGLFRKLTHCVFFEAEELLHSMHSSSLDAQARGLQIVPYQGRPWASYLIFYSALIPSFFIRGTTSFSSLSSIAASSCGVLDFVSAVRSANFFTTAGSLSVFTMAALSVARISGGSLAGANRPV